MTPLDDATAVYIVKTIAQARLNANSGGPSTTPDPGNEQLRAVLTTAFGDPPETAPSEGELARAALDILVQDPANAEPIKAMADHYSTASEPRSYIDPAGIALTTAALLVLQTRVKFNVDHTGKWSVKLEKQSAGDSAVKVLVQHLLSFLGK